MSKYTVSTYTITGFGVDLTAFGKHHIPRPFVELINHFEDLADSSVNGDICWDDQADRPELGAYLYFPNRPIVGNPDQKHYEINEANQLLTNTVRRMLILIQANPKKYDLDSLSNDDINNLINEFQRWTNNNSHHMTVQINHYITEN